MSAATKKGSLTLSELSLGEMDIVLQKNEPHCHIFAHLQVVHLSAATKKGSLTLSELSLGEMENAKAFLESLLKLLTSFLGSRSIWSKDHGLRIKVLGARSQDQGTYGLRINVLGSRSQG